MGALFFVIGFIPLTLLGLAAINIYLYGWDSFKQEIQKESQVTAITHDSVR
ncbi:hypothetical protein [Bacillus norwichensis]|uniref:Uncharacterized protein n=1 Tax=Bacillus norwichensis TaxID=2762217 RepID=A0ABR8VII9_9BACI|nr:hypothetical protein [Bacillus norwichensis]MBD8004564.1 hypothetical protein [Bacillus norwichensis]